MGLRKALIFTAIVLVSPARPVWRHVGGAQVVCGCAVGGLVVRVSTVTVEVQRFFSKLCKRAADQKKGEKGDFRRHGSYP